MRKLLFTWGVMLVATFSAFSQYNLDYGFSVGGSSYLGEIGGGAGDGRGGFQDMKISDMRWNLGGYLRYKMSRRFALKAALNYIRLTGNDAKTENPGRRGRNLVFKNDMFELTVNTELYVYKVNDVGGSGRYSTDFNLYLFGGIGMFYSNPKGQTLDGDWHALQPLQTEGVSYSKFNFTIPVGLGFYYTMNRAYRVGLEIGWRTTFTDYIDDVSTEYVEHTDPLTASLANRTTPEVIHEIHEKNPDLNGGSPQLTTYDPGKKRGDPEQDDSYATITVNFGWTIRGKSKFYRSRHSWVLGKSKRRRRKSRAKF